MRRSACSGARPSSQMMAGRMGWPSAPMGTMPSIWVVWTMASTCRGAMPDRSNTCRVVAATALHQSSGSCSAQSGRG